MKTVSFAEYRKKLKGCYQGKTVGGTLGMPCEGKTGTFALNYYDPVPTVMCANDDVDNQVIYTEELFRTGFPVNRLQLARSWKKVNFGADEYGVAKYHLNVGLNPPLSGAYENYFLSGMGGAIRSELWACMAPGDPALAVALAAEDACIDHTGAGSDAEIFLAALESAAFTESDRGRLLDVAFSYLSPDCLLSQALHDVLRWWAEEPELLRVREKIVERYAVTSWTDVVVNLCFILLGWLCGDGDFGKSICAAVNCGYDADCTGATLGALLGIIDPDGIGADWLRPIGDTLMLSPNVTGMHNPATMHEFCDSVAALAEGASRYYGGFRFDGAPAEIGRIADAIPVSTRRKDLYDLHRQENDSLLCDSPLLVTLRYPAGICAPSGVRSEFTLFISNPNETAVSGSLRLTTPIRALLDGGEAEFFLLPGETAAFPFGLLPEDERTESDPLDIVLTCGGLSFRLTAPLILEIPWRNGLTGLRDPAPGMLKEIPAGRQCYSVDVKLPNCRRVAVCCHSDRRFRLCVNGEEVIRELAPDAVPSIHRKAARIAELKNTYNHIAIEIEDGPASRFFFGIGDLDNWVWYDFLGWKLPERDEP